MKELLEQYVIEKVQMQEQLGLLLRIVTHLSEAEGWTLDLEHVASLEPAPITVENGVITCDL